MEKLLTIASLDPKYSLELQEGFLTQLKMCLDATSPPVNDTIPSLCVLIAPATWTTFCIGLVSIPFPSVRETCFRCSLRSRQEEGKCESSACLVEER